MSLIIQKLIEIVGESLNQAEKSDATIEMQIPEFRRIIDTRNRIVHGYDSVDYGLLWDISWYRIPILERALSTLLDAEDGS